MNTKVTKRNHYENIIAMLNASADAALATDIDIDAEIAFCEKEIDALDRRAERARKTAAEKRATPDELCEAVAAVLTGEFEPIDAITERVEFEGATRNKVANRLNKLANAGTAEKSEIKVADADGKTKTVVAYRAV